MNGCRAKEYHGNSICPGTYDYPFGSFEKAKYSLCAHPNSVPIYSFITTTRNTEECINIMKSMWDELKTECNECIIYKIQKGVREIIFTNKIGYDAKRAVLF